MSSSQSNLGRRKRGPRFPLKSNATLNLATSRRTGPYDRAFEQHLVDHNIFPDGYEYPDGRVPPNLENIDEILEALEQPRASLSPNRFSKEDFRKFKRAVAHATKESRVTTLVIPIIEGDPGDTKCVASDIPFTNLDHLTDGTLVCGKPDLYYGARPEQLHRKVRQELSIQIVPSTQGDLPVAPNFFVEVKGPDGSLSVASRQASYDGALGSRGIHSLQSYGTPKPHYNNKAYTLTCTYHGGTLKIYAHYPIQPSTPKAQPGYVMTQLKCWALTSDLDTFREGATAYRNGREWAKIQRHQAIAQANEKVAGLGISIDSQSDASRMRNEAPDSDTVEVTSQDTNKGLSLPVFYDSDTSADELSLDYERSVKRSRPSEKPASTFESIQNQHDPGRDKGDIPTLEPNPFKDRRKFNLTPEDRAQDEKL